MTELGHGSNVMGIETEATYDESSAEFVINTPTDTASKFWIGGAAQHGKVNHALFERLFYALPIVSQHAAASRYTSR